MVAKILLLYSNGNMLAQNWNFDQTNCVTGILLKFKNKMVVLCLSEGSRWFRMYKNKS